MLPSVSADSLPTVVLEAMASRKVVVGYKNGGICEMVSDRESGFLEPIGKSAELAIDIEKVIIDDSLYRFMAQNGYERLNNLFSLNMFYKNIDKLYQTL